MSSPHAVRTFSGLVTPCQLLQLKPGNGSVSVPLPSAKVAALLRLQKGSDKKCVWSPEPSV